jgi:hypothetical protein
MTHDTYPDIAAFVAELGRQGMAAKTVSTYTSDLASFSRWFADTTGEPFRAATVTPTDILDYKAYLRTVQAAERATAQGLTAEEVGPIDAERFVAFLWQVAGRPAEATSDWQRARPLVIALDNYSVHPSQTVVAAQPQLAAANVELVYLARYCPEQSGIEPVWNDVKQHQLPIRSFAQEADLKHAVDDALARKAQHLQRAHGKPTNLQRLAA